MTLCLGIGEVMVELASTEKPNILQRGFAGDVFNSLYYAKMLIPENWDVEFYTALGEDHLSDEIIQFILGYDIICKNIPRIKNRTPGLYMINLFNGERRFSYWRSRSAARKMMQQTNVLAEKIEKAKFIYLSGISLAILSARDRVKLLDLIEKTKTPDKTVFFDTNIRPKLWRNSKVMRSSIADAGRLADIVLPSFDDEAQAFGDISDSDVASRYLSMGAQQVIVKNGSQPVLFATALGMERVPFTSVDVVIDSTAAGDSFNGALIAYLAAGKSTKEAIKKAQECAASVITHFGALVPKEKLFTLCQL